MEGCWVSDYPVFAQTQKGDICIQALEDNASLSLSRTDKKQLLEQVPKMYIFFGRKSFPGYVALPKRVLSLLKNSAKEKYELLLSQYPQLFQRVPKTRIPITWGYQGKPSASCIKSNPLSHNGPESEIDPGCMSPGGRW